MLGHVNNAAYWQAVEEAAMRYGIDLGGPLEAVLEFRGPLDLGDEPELLFSASESGFEFGLAAAGEIRAVASIRFA